jgi:ribosomal protein L37E
VRALLFQPRFVAPILAGFKTETRRTPAPCRRCRRQAFRAVRGELECIACGLGARPRWRAELGEVLQLVERPLFSAPPMCRTNEAHGRLERQRAAAGVTAYRCAACRYTMPASFASARFVDRRIEALEAMTEDAAMRDGLCDRATFLDGFRAFAGAELASVVEAYRFEVVEARPPLELLGVEERRRCPHPGLRLTIDGMKVECPACDVRMVGLAAEPLRMKRGR